MFTKTTVPPVSIRQGKLQPSKRYDDVAAKSKAMKTNWRLGIDKAPYESTMHASQVMVARVPPEELALTQPRILKNSSNKVRLKCIASSDICPYGGAFFFLWGHVSSGHAPWLFPPSRPFRRPSRVG